MEKFGREEWAKGERENEELLEYSEWKEKLVKEEYADGSDGARVRVMLRGESLPVKNNRTVRWRWGEETRCVCGEVEEERHVLLECERLREARGDLGEWWRREMGEEDFMKGVKGFVNMTKDQERELLERVGKVWRMYEKRERERV